MRITTSQIMRNYQTALQSNLGGLTAKRNAILSGKKITNASQDPSTAVVASGLERRLVRTQSYIDSIKEVQARQDEQENAVMQLVNACVNIGENYSVSALNDPSGEGGRLTYAKQLQGLQHEMISSLNAQYTDEFVFGGKVGMEVPFTVNAEGKTCYRGVQVSPDYKVPHKLPSAAPAAGTPERDEYDKLVKENEEIEKFNAEAKEKFDKEMKPLLDEYVKESVYVDLGFGLDFTDRAGSQNPNDNNNPYRDDVISSSAFDISLPGIKVVGYGYDADGLPNNIIDLTNEMANELAKGDDWDRDRYEQLWTKFQARTKEVTDFATTLGTQTNLLDATLTRMTDSELALKTEISNMVNIDPAEAIMEYSYADYTYNAALKIGTNILSQSLLDFLG